MYSTTLYFNFEVCRMIGEGLIIKVADIAEILLV